MGANNSAKADLDVTLWGYRYSVYTRIVRMVLLHLGVPYRAREADPFADPPDPDLARIAPIGRVPVLDHAGFTLSETSAICRYLAAIFPNTALVPEAPQARARMDQAIATMDAHGYWPMVRQVFAHAVFRPVIGAAPDGAQITEGLVAAAPVLRLLNEIAAEGRILDGKSLCLADMHLAPMIGYFEMAPQGLRALRTYPALMAWWEGMQRQRVYQDTDPGIATLASGA
jgi:glutathione S-transferase